MILNEGQPEAWRIHSDDDAAPTLYAERPPAILSNPKKSNRGEGIHFYYHHKCSADVRELLISPCMGAERNTNASNDNPLIIWKRTKNKRVFPINSMVIGKDGGDNDRQTFGIGQDGEPCPTLQTGHHHAVAISRTTFGIDQQGGKGGANYTENVAPTICSDSHGTPHGIADIRHKNI